MSYIFLLVIVLPLFPFPSLVMLPYHGRTRCSSERWARRPGVYSKGIYFQQGHQDTKLSGLKKQTPISDSSNTERCWRQMITLLRTAKLSFHIVWEKAVVHHPTISHENYMAEKYKVNNDTEVDDWPLRLDGTQLELKNCWGYFGVLMVFIMRMYLSPWDIWLMLSCRKRKSKSARIEMQWKHGI